MATLADVSKKLEKQNDILTDVDKEITSISGSLKAFAYAFAKNEDLQKYDQLEKDREATNEKTTTTRAEVKSGGMMESNISNPFQFGAIAALAGTLFKKVFNFKNLARFALLAFANDIEESISREFNVEDSETRLAIRNGIKFAAIGSIFGKKFMALGLLLGTVINEDTKKQFDEATKNIEEAKKAFAPEIDALAENLKQFGIDISNIDLNPINFVFKQINQALEAIVKLKTGDLDVTSAESVKETAANALDVIEGAAVAGGAAYVAKRTVFGRGKQKQVQQTVEPTKPMTPKVGQSLTHNGTKYTWKGAQWVSDSGNKIATKEVAAQLTKQATTKVPWWVKGLKFLSSAPALGIQAALYSPELGNGELPADFNPETGYAFAEQMSEGKTGNSMPVAAIASQSAQLLTEQATINIANAKMAGQPVVIQDNSVVQQGGSTTNQAMVLPPTPPVDRLDQVR
jgi:hypothetical protein